MAALVALKKDLDYANEAYSGSMDTVEMTPVNEVKVELKIYNSLSFCCAFLGHAASAKKSGLYESCFRLVASLLLSLSSLPFPLMSSLASLHNPDADKRPCFLCCQFS